jgi:hypothetical protein
MALKTARALRQVREAFEHLSGQMQRMHTDCQIKPNDVTVISVTDSGADVRLSCAPVACRVPERASHGSAELYIVFTGSITFNGAIEDELETINYGTNFAYFAIRDAGASHVLGGHYDFSPGQVAHPRAHLQLGSQADLYAHAQSSFRSIAETPLEADLMKDVLNRARPPSAQMDFLSFMLQVCADHLVDEKSAPQVVSMFEALSSSCSPVLGYHRAITGVCGCHRAPHWYPTTTGVS